MLHAVVSCFNFKGPTFFVELASQVPSNNNARLRSIGELEEGPFFIAFSDPHFSM